MTKMIKKIVKITLWSLLSILVLGVACVGLAVNILLTPEKVTPIINKIAKNNINAEIDIKSVDVSFFKTIPYIEISIDSVKLSKDSISKEEIMSIAKVSANIDPFALLTQNKISTNKIIINSPKALLDIDKDGKSIIDSLFIVSPQNDSIAADSAMESSFDYKIHVNKIEISDADIKIDDRAKGVVISTDSLNIMIRAKLEKIESAMLIDISTPRISFKDSLLNIKDKPIAIKTSVKYNKDSLKIYIGESLLSVNNLELNIAGEVTADTVTKALDINLNVGLHTPSLSNFFNLIPLSLIQEGHKLKTKGEVNLQTTIKGTYSSSQMPIINGKLTINNASAKYNSMKWGIDKVYTDIDMYIDLMNAKKSYVDINNLDISVADSSSLKLKARITDILQDPYITFDIKNNINITNLSKVFPLQEGVVIKGFNKTDMKGILRVSDIKKMDYGKLSLNGTSIFENMLIDIDGSKVVSTGLDSSYLFAEIIYGKLAFGNKIKNGDDSNLSGDITLNGISVKGNKGNKMSLKDIAMNIDSDISSDSTKITRIISNFTVGGGSFEIPDTLKTKISQSYIHVAVEPRKDDSTKAVVSISLQSDSLMMTIPYTQNYTDLSSAKIEITALPPTDTTEKWQLSGDLRFDNLSLFTESFPIKVTLPSSQLTLQNDTITLKNTPIQYGNDLVTASGFIRNMIGTALKRNDKGIKAVLSIKSKLVNIDTILRVAMNTQIASKVDSTNVRAAATTIDSTETTIIEIPKDIDVALDIEIDSVIYDKVPIKNVDGHILLRNGSITMSNLNVNIMGADMFSYINYKPVNSDKAKVGLKLDIKKIDISKLTVFLPLLDTMAPMIKSMEGIVSFDMLADGDIDKNYMFDILSLNGVMRLKGTDLVLLDNETFSTISKMLMFKNKNRNLIDSLNVDIIAQKGNIDVMPFELTMDRYRMIVGGTQKIDPKTYDMDFKYNVSILKSPLPFKAGVDIFGNFDTFDYKITKAKLKKTDFEMQSNNMDSIMNVMNNKIFKQPK